MFCHFKGTVVILVVWHTHTLPRVQVCHISVDNSFKHGYNFSVDFEKSVATALSRPTDKKLDVKIYPTKTEYIWVPQDTVGNKKILVFEKKLCHTAGPQVNPFESE